MNINKLYHSNKTIACFILFGCTLPVWILVGLLIIPHVSFTVIYFWAIGSIPAGFLLAYLAVKLGYSIRLKEEEDFWKFLHSPEVSQLLNKRKNIDVDKDLSNKS